jgi:hypothetical protein
MEFAKINVRVRDVRAAVEYVQRTLGGEVLTPPHNAPFGEVAVVRISGLTMEIIQPPPGSPMASAIERRGEGIDSVGFMTEDVSASASVLEERGAQLVRPGAEGLAETVWVHPKNPLSMSIELFPSSASPGSLDEAPGRV